MSRKKSWKESNLDYLDTVYGSYKAKYDHGYGDDRQIFVNIYNMIVESVRSLPDDPDVYVCVAMNNLINEDTKKMDKIKNYFEGREKSWRTSMVLTENS